MILRKRGIRLALLLASAGTLAVLLAAGSTLLSPRVRPDVVVSPPGVPPAGHAPLEPTPELGETTDQALERARTELRAARGQAEKAELTRLLMRLAELLRESGHEREAREALAEVQAIRPVDHWENREAVRRVVDLDAEAKRPEPERQRLRQARELYRSASALERVGRYLPAVPVCEKALAIRRELLPPAHHDTADSLLLLGRLQASRGELYGRAFETLSQARELVRKTHGELHPRYSACLHELAALEDDRGAFVEAQDLYNAALDVALKTRGEFSADYARSLARLARMHGDWWVTGAEAKVTRAMHVRETVLGANHPEYADSLQDLGVIMFRSLQIEKARDLFQRAKQIRGAALGPSHPAVAESLSWLGRAMVDEADFTAGHEYHRQAVALAEQAHGPDHPQVARFVSNFARLSMEEHDFDRGDRLIARALAIRKRHGLTRHPLHGEYLKARADNLQEWCFIAAYLEGRDVDVRPAVAAYEEATRLFESLPTGEMLPDYAGTLLAHAELYYINDYRLKSHADCRSLVARGEKLMLLSGPLKGHPNYFQYLTSNIHLAAWEGDVATADPLVDTLIAYCDSRFGYAFPTRRSGGVDKKWGLQLRGRDDGKPLTPRELSLFETGRDRELLFIRRVQDCQSTSARLRMLVSSTEYLHGITSLALRFGVPLDIYQNSLAVRGLVGSAQTVDSLAHGRPELAPLVSRLREARRDLTRVVYTPPQRGEDRPAWLEQVYRLGDLRDDLESELAIRVREGAPAQPVPVATDVQAALPPATTLVEYCNFQYIEAPPGGRGRLVRTPSLAAFVVRRDGPPKLVPLGRRAPVEEAINAWRKAVAESQAGSAGDRLPAATARVAKLLWEPVAPHIGSADTLLISSDGLVGLVPFAVFPGKAPGTYLLEDYTIGYTPAGRRVAGEAKAGGDLGDGLLTVGDVEYAPGGAGRVAHPVLRGLPRLPGSAVEVADVRRRFAAARPGAAVVALGGRAATLDAFTAAVAGRPRFVHFAGHGFFADPGTFPDVDDGPAGRNGLFSRGRTAHPAVLRNQPLLGGLVLAPGAHPADVLLTAEQVASLDLRSAELVVLSACETGVGDVAIGEGAMSLQRAFLTAGTRTVVGSLWKVDDAATAALMDEFYLNLWERKQPKLTALRNAQLALLRRPELIAARADEMRSRGIDTSRVRPLPADSGTGKRADLTLWGAFVLTGDAR